MIISLRIITNENKIIKKGDVMNIKRKLVFLLSSSMLIINTGCEDDKATTDDKVVEITTPTTYTFNSRFVEDGNAVSYSGQVVRNLLINDIKTQMGVDAGSKNPATLLSIMANDNADSPILSASGMTTVQTKYQDISSSQLNDRLTAVDSYTIPGYDANATALINGWVNELAQTGKTRASGIRLDQITQKTLWGAVSYWQATSKYMSKIPTDDNTVAVEGKTYTSMEHHWDEAFGYLYGAEEDETAPVLGVDSFLSKYLDKVEGDSDFTGIADDIYDAFKLGRAAIVAKNYTVRDEQVEILREKISMIIGIRAVYYLQVGKTNLGVDNASAFHDLSEGFGFVYGLQFTRNSMTDAPYVSKSMVDGYIDTLMTGNGFWDVTAETLDQMSEDIAAEFGFTVEQAAN